MNDMLWQVGLITGQKPFASEQKSLVKFGCVWSCCQIGLNCRICKTKSG
jgi:hypothetical protein